MDYGMYKKIIVIFLFLVSNAILITLAGCTTVGPDYVRPEISVAPQWKSTMSDGLNAEPMDPSNLARWWQQFKDPVLDQLVTRAIAENLDIKAAKERLHQSRAERGIARSDLFPSLDASGSATRSKSNQNSGTGKESDFFSLGFDASWELDLFGGTRRSVEAADASLKSSGESLRNVQVTIVGEVAQTYIEIRTLQKRLTAAVTNLTIQEETYKLTKIRSAAGLDDDLAQQQALYNLENTRSQLPSLRTSLEESKNSLAVLLGERPGDLDAILDNHAQVPAIPATVAVGVPADALRQRPDVKQAEYELMAQTARVGVAVADLYPKLTLNGAIGLDSVTTVSLFDSKSASHSYGLHLSWPIFNANAIRLNIEVRNSLQEQALLNYKAAILSALEEVENILVAYGEEQNRYQSLEKAAQAAEVAVTLADSKYQAGLIDFSSLLDTQRSLNSLEDQLVQSKGTMATNLIRLFKAMGGGWTSLAEQNSDKAALS